MGERTCTGTRTASWARVGWALLAAVALVMGLVVPPAPAGAAGTTTVIGWGYNNLLQATPPVGLTGVTAIAAGPFHSLALLEGGTVVGWGDNGYYGGAQPPEGLSGVTGIAVGNGHSLALLEGGTVVGWSPPLRPSVGATPPAGLSGVVAITAGRDFSLALKGDGTMVGWGDNSGNLLPVPALDDVIAISAGDRYCTALREDGTVVEWGNYATAIPPGLDDVIAITAGYNHRLALRSDHTVVAWGSNYAGQTDVPIGLTDVAALAAGAAHSLALKADGTIVGWGRNGLLQAQAPPGVTFATAIAAGWGGDHSLALVPARQAQTITWTTTPPASVTAGQAFPVAATATSGLPVDITTTGPCDYASGTVTTTSSGTCTVLADQAGNADWLPAPQLSAPVTVTPAPHAQTITWTTAPPPSVTAGTTFPVMAAATSALTVTITTTGPCSYSSGTVTTTGPGTCTVLADQAGNALWLAAPQLSAAVTVAPAPPPPQAQTITWTTAPPASVTAGQAFPVAATASSGLPVTISTTGPCTYAAGTVTTTGPGTCTALADQAGNADWLPAPQLSASVTVTTAQPSVRVKLKAIGNKSKFRVDVNPNKGRGYWTFRVQRLQPDDSWLTLPKVYKTLGAKETRTVDLPRGTYRVVVDAKYNYDGATSNQVYLRR